MDKYLLLFSLVLLVGLIPAFGPPSWVFAVFFYHKYKLAFLVVVIVTAISTTIGRILLSLVTKKLKRFLPNKILSNLEYAKDILERRRKSTWLFIGLFVVSPLPSAQLFEAVGLLQNNLLSLGGAFLIGRIISLSFYLLISTLVVQNISQLWSAGLTNPWILSVEIICILAVLILLNLKRSIYYLQKIKTQVFKK